MRGPPEGRETGAGADHDDGPGGVLGQAKVRVLADKDGDLCADLEPLSNKRGADADAALAQRLVPDHGDGALHPPGVLPLGGGDRVQAGLELAQAAQDLVGGRPVPGEVGQDVEQVPAGLEVGLALLDVPEELLQPL